MTLPNFDPVPSSAARPPARTVTSSPATAAVSCPASSLAWAIEPGIVLFSSPATPTVQMTPVSRPVSVKERTAAPFLPPRW